MKTGAGCACVFENEMTAFALCESFFILYGTCMKKEESIIA